MSNTKTNITKHFAKLTDSCHPERETYTYRGLPAIGFGTKVFDEIKNTIVCDWEGRAVQIGTHPDKFKDVHYFSPGDKGIPRVYGCDKTGRAIVSIVMYSGDYRSANLVEREPHFFFAICG